MRVITFALIFAIAFLTGWLAANRQPVDCEQLAVSLSPHPDPFPYVFKLNCRDGRTVYLAH